MAELSLESKEHVGKTISTLCMALVVLKWLLLGLQEGLPGLTLLLSFYAYLLSVLPQLGSEASWQSEG